MVYWITGTKYMLHGSKCISIVHFLENFITLTLSLYLGKNYYKERSVSFLSRLLK